MNPPSPLKSFLYATESDSSFMIFIDLSHEKGLQMTATHKIMVSMIQFFIIIFYLFIFYYYIFSAQWRKYNNTIMTFFFFFK